nr:hypothetical protein [Tanacetum cinerariifolium]
QNRKLPVCYDDDDDEEESNSLKDNIIFKLPPCSAITPNEPIDSLSMGDDHLDTIPATKSDELIKSCVENLVPNLSESEGENGYNVPSCFTTFSNILFDDEYEFNYVDDQSLHNEDFSEKIFSNPLFEEEIISIRIDQNHFNAESDLVESMLNQFNSENSNADIESFSPSPILIKDSDSHMEEIDLSFNPDDPMPPSIEDDEDSEGDTLSLERLLHDDLIPLPDTLDFSYECQPKNHDYYHEQNSCYDSNSFGIDHRQTSQYTANHPVFNVHNYILHSQNKLTITQNKVMEQMTQLTYICEMACQIVQKKLEEKQIEEEQAAKAQNRKLPICYDDDDDEEESNSLKDNIISELPPCSAITPNETIDSLSMGDEHLDTILAMKSDELIKSCVENLVPNPNFSEKIFSNPLFEEEIISIRIDQHHFNAKSNLVESMLNRDSSIISSSSKIDSLRDEFAGELTLLKSIPPGIDKTDCHLENEIRLSQRLLYDNSSPRPSEEFNSENSNADIESFSLSPILIKDSDSHMEEIYLSFNPDDPMPPSIEDDEDSEGDTLSLERLLHDDLIPLPDTLDFSYEVRVFLPFFTYPVTYPVLLSSGSEDKIFNPGITINRSYSF